MSTEEGTVQARRYSMRLHASLLTISKGKPLKKFEEIGVEA